MTGMMGRLQHEDGAGNTANVTYTNKLTSRLALHSCRKAKMRQDI